MWNRLLIAFMLYAARNPHSGSLKHLYNPNYLKLFLFSSIILLISELLIPNWGMCFCSPFRCCYNMKTISRFSRIQVKFLLTFVDFLLVFVDFLLTFVDFLIWLFQNDFFEIKKSTPNCSYARCWPHLIRNFGFPYRMCCCAFGKEVDLEKTQVVSFEIQK